VSWRPKSSLIYKDSNSEPTKHNKTKFIIFSPFNGFREHSPERWGDDSAQTPFQLSNFKRQMYSSLFCNLPSFWKSPELKPNPTAWNWNPDWNIMFWSISKISLLVLLWWFSIRFCGITWCLRRGIEELLRIISKWSMCFYRIVIHLRRMWFFVMMASFKSFLSMDEMKNIIVQKGQLIQVLHSIEPGMTFSLAFHSWIYGFIFSSFYSFY